MTRQLAAIGGVVLSASLALAGQPAKVKEYDLASGNVTGDVVKGPRTIRAKGLNALRYDYRFNSAIAFSQPVDLWSKLVEIAAPPAATTAPQSGPAKQMLGSEKPGCNPPSPSSQITGEVVNHVCAARDLESNVNTALDEIKGIEGTGSDVDKLANDYQVYSKLVREASAATGAVSLAGKALNNFLATTTGNSARTVEGIREQLNTDSTFMKGKDANWPDDSKIGGLAQRTDERQGRLNQLKSTLDTYSSAMVSDIAAKLGADAGRATEEAAKAYVQGGQEKLNDANTVLDQARKLLASVTSDNSKIAAGLPDLQPGSQKYNAFTAAHDVLVLWEARMRALDGKSADAFSLTAPAADCEFAFSRTKTTTVTLTRVDQMPGTTATNPETVLSVVVECTSPFTVSAGVAFSTLKEREFGIQPVADPQGSTTTTNRFVAATKSSFHPLPLGMIHARLWEPKDQADWFSFHMSFGLAGNFRSQSSGGSEAEFLIGPSFSLFRTMFFTPGLHLGREVSLGAGFRENDLAPAGITTPPLQKAYKPAFGFAVTFTKP